MSANVEKKSSRNKILLILSMIVITILVLSGIIVLLGSNMLSPFGISQGVTMVDLQDDYLYQISGSFPVGHFKSYDDGDKILFRDKIIEVDSYIDDRFDKEVTRLYFSAHFLPMEWDIEQGRAINQSWYFYKQISGGYQHGTIFNMAGASAYIALMGDATNSFKTGNTVEITLHVTALLTGHERIDEFYSIKLEPEEIRIIG